LERAQKITPALREASPRIREARRLPSDVVELLRETGVFGMAVPRAWGGPELDPLSQFEVLEVIAHADASAGWCAMIGCDTGFYGAFLDDAVGRATFGDTSLISAGMTGPGNAKAVREGDGWRVTGRWSFGSGSTHADRIVGGSMLYEPDGSMVGGGGGFPEFRTFVLPMDAVELHDTWFTTGLEGSGSGDYSVDGALIPDERCFHPLLPTKREENLYRLPWWFIVKVAAVVLGIGRRAVDEAMAIADTKLVMPDFLMLRDRPLTHVEIAKAEASVASARAYLVAAIGAVWDTTAAGEEPSPRQRATLRLAMTNAGQAARDAVTRCYDLAGTTAIQASCPLDGLLRDINTADQHLVLNQRTYEAIGRVLLGVESSGLMI
jgi:alkylation response protein AidB-like acyl-CoA dehydrogenase